MVQTAHIAVGEGGISPGSIARSVNRARLLAIGKFAYKVISGIRIVVLGIVVAIRNSPGPFSGPYAVEDDALLGYKRLNGGQVVDIVAERQYVVLAAATIAFNNHFLRVAEAPRTEPARRYAIESVGIDPDLDPAAFGEGRLVGVDGCVESPRSNRHEQHQQYGY